MLKNIIKALGIIIFIQETFQTQGNIPINISSLDSSLQDIHWCGENSTNDQGVVLLTSKGSVYISENRGINWQKKVEQFIREGINAQQNLNEDVGYVYKMIASPINSNEIVFIGSQGINWISTDCGITVKSLGANMNLKEFAFHPVERTWMMASSWSTCDSNSQKILRMIVQLLKIYICHKTLVKNGNFQPNMLFSLHGIIKFSSFFLLIQRAQKYIIAHDKIPMQRILYFKEIGSNKISKKKKKKKKFQIDIGSQRIQGWNMKTHLFYSDDFLQNEQNMIVNQGNKFLITENYLFAAQVFNSETQEVKLMVANANSFNYNFDYVVIDQNIFQHSFTILDTSEGQVFLNLNQYGSKSPLGEIYQSDSTGRRYSLSLQNNMRSQDGQCDFEKLYGVDGIYIANVYDGKKVEQYKKDLQQQSQTEGDENIEKNHEKPNLEKYLQTRITFNKGGDWIKIRAPSKDSQDHRIDCDYSKGCSLHLHSVSSKMEFGPVYSSENSIGLVIGTGNIGYYLQQKANKTNTYLSRDGGLSWFEIKKGSHIYEMADHGALILLAPNQVSTDSLYYSWDEGLTWNTIKISTTLININNIITEPGNISDKFIIYGELDNQELEENKGVVISIDFSSLHPRVCEGQESPGNADSDYEYWVPHNPGEGCLLGKEIKIVRRKRNAQCFNSENFERPVSVRRCECTELDWECDLGFERVTKDSVHQCIPIQGYQGNVFQEECTDYYFVSNGYRKIAGNQCTGGIDHEPTKVSCLIFGVFKRNGFFSQLLFFTFLGFMAYFGYQNKEKVKKILTNIKVDLMVEKIRELLNKNNNVQKGYVNLSQNDEETFRNGESHKESYQSNQDKERQEEDDLINKMV
ncbi:hypothetical protein IMG5_088080 [Ichthyophthirius multifiliis]|uniref:VPS10 domain-containing protein n=1 Tax=Ichthyophthirius multifiliis TaxID=5932 RepID=G0QR35_ICHMU|nr:hypothetical protein IMG5_088080 [Ichthyophthirius multifiliis]EGR32320.1 hypothetical protein IMG5_088080 [Ichthyophthirius multifiliis]|eukprot:XP_004035806.1 hypothetical protein IMG5_088080 [Ichthyophthirius multifiliis]